jgi:dolichol-phosphate mannosyltransferase
MRDIAESVVQFSLIVPTFNERDNLIPLVHRVQRALAGHPFELIIVDDDSPDQTWQLAQDLSRDNHRLRVIRRTGQRGLATAVVTGWNNARGRILGVMDGDLQYPPELLPQLLKAVEGISADIVIASRYVPGATIEQWGFLRKLNSWGARLLARLALPGVSSEIRDPGAGCFVMQRKVIENTDLRPLGYKILLEVLARGHYTSVMEIPHDYKGRTEGYSKLDFRQHAAFLSHLVRLARETGEFRRVLRSCVVDLSSVFVALGVVVILTEAYGMHYLYAGSAALVCSIANNFVWNELWTFADRTRKSGTFLDRIKRFLLFSKVCVGGVLLALVVLWLLMDIVGLHYLASTVIALPLAGVWNHSFHTKNTWVSWQAQFRDNGWYTAAI